MFSRSSGILMHISSLPSKYGIGDFGEEAYKFVDGLAEAKQKLWQILPLVPTGCGDSPYQSSSAFAGNFLFIDFEYFIQNGYIEKNELKKLLEYNNENKVEFSLIKQEKERVLKKCFESFFKNMNENSSLKKDYQSFLEENKFWLDTYCLYMALKIKFNDKPWNEWPKAYKFHDLKKIILDKKDNENIDYNRFVQYIFYRQWEKLKRYANEKNIKIIGDIPIFVATDSADTWSHRDLFMFTESGVPKRIAGCPPDYFSKTGQLWGNVLYNWKNIEKEHFHWWIERVRYAFKLYDIVRIDHFRGFEAYWSIKYGALTAIKGRWEKGPGMKLFNALEKSLGKLPIIAEDLGFLTPGVERLLAKTKCPGMKILEFAFGGGDSKYLPHNFTENCVAYTGTHDNDTIVGWYESISSEEKNRCDEYLKGWLVDRNRNFWNPIELRCIDVLWCSKANMVLIQMQDLLGLESWARMNTPATISGNWCWRMKPDAFTKEKIEVLKEVTERFNR